MSTALVFAGGGANGAFGAGVEAVLRKEGEFSWDAVYGVSSGALNAVLIGQGRPDVLRRLWLEQTDDVVRRRRVWSFAWGLLFGTTGVYDNSRLRELMGRLVNEAPFKMPTVAGYVDLHSGQYRTATQSHPEFAELVIASTSIPIVFDLPEHAGSQLADGGLRNVTPLKTAIEAGHDHLVVILNRPETLRPKGRVKGLLDVFGRTIDILTHEVAINDIAQCETINRLVLEAGGTLGQYRYVELTIVRPSRDLGESLDFSATHAREAMLQGEIDARRYLL